MYAAHGPIIEGIRVLEEVGRSHREDSTRKERRVGDTGESRGEANVTVMKKHACGGLCRRVHYGVDVV